jgi:hypothetical protein
MGLLAAFVKGKILQKVLSGSGRAANASRARGGLFGRKMMIAAVAAMMLKRAFRR